MALPEENRELGVPLARDLPSGCVYRYRPYDATELRLLLAGGQLRFSNPHSFNDPWDCRPRIVAPISADPTEWKRVAHEVVQLFAGFRPDVSPESLDGFESHLGADAQALQRALDSSADEILPAIRGQYPVLCLSDSWDIPSMWAHYARAYRGVCLIFDAAADPIIGGALQVQYADELPEIALLGTPPGAFVRKAVLTKHTHWAGEREYRAVARERKEGERDVDWNPTSEGGFVNVAPRALLGIILGPLIDPADAASARRLVASARHRIDISRAELHRSKYALIRKRES